MILIVRPENGQYLPAPESKCLQRCCLLPAGHPVVDAAEMVTAMARVAAEGLLVPMVMGSALKMDPEETKYLRSE